MAIAERLLQHGADVNTIDPNGGEPLLTAVRNGTPEMVQLLLRYGANKEIVDGSGSTPLDLAQGSEEIISLLQEPQLLHGPLPINERLPQSLQPLTPNFRAPKHDPNKMIALHGFHATVADFFIGDEFENRIEKSLSVYELLYGTQQVMEGLQTGVENGRKRDFRWYRLPANNIEWVGVKAHYC
ncbi:hypothetical protein GGR58DRAFT_489880 [Xylaria digitata]|nr:hypothetical protein GGR58DRAFT_489880 [Xylaria digitata]